MKVYAKIKINPNSSTESCIVLKVLQCRETISPSAGALWRLHQVPVTQKSYYNRWVLLEIVAVNGVIHCAYLYPSCVKSTLGVFQCQYLGCTCVTHKISLVSQVYLRWDVYRFFFMDYYNIFISPVLKYTWWQLVLKLNYNLILNISASCLHMYICECIVLVVTSNC